MNGRPLPAAIPDSTARESAKAIDMATVHDLVAPSDVDRYGEGDTKILLIDAGVKDNITRSLVNRDATVVRVGGIMAVADLARRVGAARMAASRRLAVDCHDVGRILAHALDLLRKARLEEVRVDDPDLLAKRVV